ncbi:MAG TPA: acetylxylan esterase, partial [Pirellulales bacterium]
MALSLLFGLATLQAAEAAPEINTIDELWAGYDPRAQALEIDVIKQVDEEGLRLETLYFTGEVFEGEKTRVFGYYGRPARPEGKLPGILHIHGGGQTANLAWVRYWAQRGYCALSFDFCGDTNLPTLGPEYRREHFTRWGKVQADMMKIGGRQMEPTPRHNAWFHWTMAARRGLTLLESQPHVDADRLGIFGISVGGTLTWIVAGVDPRVKVAAPIYGCGWESYPEFPPQPAAPVDRPTQLWRALIAPETHAPRITCPVLFFNATCDFHGRMDLAYETLDRLPAATERRQVFTPNYDHHIEPAEAYSLPLWMSAHLKGTPANWPATPRIEIAGSDPMPLVRVASVNPGEVERVDVYYALNNDWPMTRFWRSIAAERGADGVFTAAAPVLGADDTIYAFANVTYRSTIRISSRLLKQPVKELIGVRPTLVRTALVDTMETSADWCWVPAYTDPNQG